MANFTHIRQRAEEVPPQVPTTGLHRTWPKGWLQLLQLFGLPAAVKEHRLLGLPGSQEAAASWAGGVGGNFGFLHTYNTRSLLCSSWQTTVVEGLKEGKRVCGGCRIRKKHHNSKPCKTMCHKLCSSPVCYLFSLYFRTFQKFVGRHCLPCLLQQHVPQLCYTIA